MSNVLQHTFVTSDHHFGSYRLPSFLSVYSRDEEIELIDKWNSIVGKDDIVYYNGDFSDASTVVELCNYAKQLNGNIILILGNHDSLGIDVYKAVFKDVVDEIVLDDLDLTIHHCPGTVKTKNQVFGHLHRDRNIDKTNGFCSCVQRNSGYPVSLERIAMSFK